MTFSTIGDNNAARRVEDQIFRSGRDLRGAGFHTLMFTMLAISVLFLGVLLVQVTVDAWPTLSTRFGDFMSGTLRSRSSDDQLGISQGLRGTAWIAAFVTFLSFPIGIFAAIYLEEYAPRNRLTGVIDIAIRNLAGVPSVVYGLLGLFLFVKLANNGQSSMFAGGLILAILVLPIVVITAAEAIRAVPSSLKQGAYGVGATKWDVIRTQVLPFAAPGILTGTLLSLSRAVGEAAPLILVGAITGRLAPRDSSLFEQLGERFTAMPIIIVGWVRNSGVDPGLAPAAGAAIVVLLVMVIAMNSVAVLLRSYFERKRG